MEEPRAQAESCCVACGTLIKTSAVWSWPSAAKTEEVESLDFLGHLLRRRQLLAHWLGSVVRCCVRGGVKGGLGENWPGRPQATPPPPATAPHGKSGEDGKVEGSSLLCSVSAR